MVNAARSESPEADRRPSTPPNSNNLQALPYVFLNGAYTIPDIGIESIYYKMHQDGTFESVFYDGSVKSLGDFFGLLRNPLNLPVVCLVDGIIGGIAWLNEFKINHATCHFCVFKEHWGGRSLQMGRAVLKYWFSFPSVEVLLGVTPSDYKLPIRFIKQLGFTILGEVPRVVFNANNKSFTGATLSYLVGEDFGRT